MRVLTPEVARKALVKIPRDANKGTKGTAAIFAGSYGMAGAAILSARAAMRSGAGIVRLCVDDSIYPILATALPEVVFRPFSFRDNSYFDENLLKNHIKGARSLLIGPGLGNTQTTEKLVKSLLKITTVPTVVDADGLNCIVNDLDILKSVSAEVIVTPHPGEMARLIKTDIDTVQNNRVEVAEGFANTYGVITVLKGAYTVIASPSGETYINKTGCEGMATAGSGDMLSGMIAAFLANGTKALIAAAAAVCLHGEAGEKTAARLGVRGMTVSDMIENLPLVLN